MVMGRPSSYTQELADNICHKLSEGMSLRTVCKGDEMPSIATVFSWFRTKPDFLAQYTRAKEESADAMVEEMLDIADNGENDTYVRKDEDGNVIEGVNHDHINRSRLRVDARKWVASKLKPKKYGDKQVLEHTGKITLEQSIAQTIEQQKKLEKDASVLSITDGEE